MNILEIEDMVKGLPDDRLQQEAEMPTGQVPQFLVVSEIQRRADMRKRFSERQQEQPQGTVKDQIVQEGIAAMAPPEPQMQAAMMGGPQPMPPQMPMQPEGPMPPQMPMAPQGPMPPQGMAEGGVVRMAEGLTTPYFEAIKGYRGEVMPLRQQLAKLTDRGASAAERESLEDQIYSMYQDYGLDQYSVDEKRSGLLEATSPEDIRRAYDLLGLNPNRYADIVGSIGTYAGEGEDNQDVNLPTATTPTPTVQEEPLGETRKTASVRGSRGNYTASVEGPSTRDASTTIPTFQRLMEEADELPRKEQFGEIIDYLRRGDVQYDEEGRERFAIDPTRPRARDIPELTVVGERLKADGPLFGPAYTPEDQLSGAVKTDAKRGLYTGTAFDPEVIRLATAPDSSGGLYSVLGQDLTAMSVQDESNVRGGDASVQGPTGRQSGRTRRRRRGELEELVENNTDASSVVLGQDSPISGINRDLISQLIRDPESVDFGASLARYKAQADAELASTPIATTGDTTGTDVSDDSYAAIARKIDNLGVSESGAAIDGTVSGFPTRTAYAPDYTQFQPNYREMIEAAETRAREARERGRREAGAQALIQLGAGIAGGDLPGGISRAGESARLARRDAQQDASADEQLAQRMLIAEQEARMKLGIEGERAKQEESKIADDYAIKGAEYVSARTDADRKFQLDKLTQLVTAKRYGDLSTESEIRARRDQLTQYRPIIQKALDDWILENQAPSQGDEEAYAAYMKELRRFHEGVIKQLGIDLPGGGTLDTSTDEGGVPPGANTGAVTRDSLGLRG